MDYFIKKNESEKSQNNLDNDNFCICSILMRRLCSPFEANDGDSTNKEDINDYINYFNSLINFCLKYHKNKVKEFKKLIESNEMQQEDQAAKLKLNTFYIDFIKTYVYYSSELNSKFDMKIDSEKFCKQLFNYYISFNKKQFEFDLNFSNKYKSLNNESNEDKDALTYMRRILAVSINTLSVEQFKSMLDYFESKTLDSFKTNNDSENVYFLTKLSYFIKFASSEFEIKEELKPEFAVFIQKVI